MPPAVSSPAPGAAPSAAPGTTLTPQQVAKIQRAAQDFEAMALNQLLAPMFETVDTSRGPFGGGEGEQAWKPMMVQEMSKAIARAGGLGLAKPVMEQMLRMQEARQQGTPDAP